MPTTRRLFLSLMGSTALAGLVPAFAAPARRKPNFIVILCDDLGYGDIEPTGGKAIPTPNLNRMARQGMVLHGRLLSLAAETIAFAGDLATNLDQADAVYRRIRDSIDAYIQREGIEAPEEPPYQPCWQPPTPR